MEINKDPGYRSKLRILIIKIIAIIVLSIFLYLSLRTHLLFSKNIYYLLTYLFFQLALLFWIFTNNIFINTICIIAVLNFLLTPAFFNITFDAPTRYPNTQSTIIWNKNLNQGFLDEKHNIVTNERGHRVNKKINYEKKEDETLRIFAIGASTTEEEGLDGKYIWTNNLIKELEKSNYLNYKNFEMINFGLSGLRSVHHYLTLRRNVNLEPDIAIFLLGVNDWNHHILHSKYNYLFPNIEILYNYELSILNKFSSKIFRVLKKPFNDQKLIIVDVEVKKSDNPYLDLIKSQAEIKKNIQKSTFLEIDDVSEEYKIWLKKISKTCKTNKLECIFVDQPSQYDVSNLNKKNLLLWMNPPYANYKIKFEAMIKIKNTYNNYLENFSNQNSIKFCKLSDKIEPTIDNFIDDVHFTINGSKEVALNLYNCIKN